MIGLQLYNKFLNELKLCPTNKLRIKLETYLCNNNYSYYQVCQIQLLILIVYLIDTFDSSMIKYIDNTHL